MSDYTNEQVFKIGDRVELHPTFGVYHGPSRFGTISRMRNAESKIIFVTMDETGRMKWFHRCDLRHID